MLVLESRAVNDAIPGEDHEVSIPAGSDEPTLVEAELLGGHRRTSAHDLLDREESEVASVVADPSGEGAVVARVRDALAEDAQVSVRASEDRRVTHEGLHILFLHDEEHAGHTAVDGEVDGRVPWLLAALFGDFGEASAVKSGDGFEGREHEFVGPAKRPDVVNGALADLVDKVIVAEMLKPAALGCFDAQGGGNYVGDTGEGGDVRVAISVDVEAAGAGGVDELEDLLGLVPGIDSVALDVRNLDRATGSLADVDGLLDRLKQAGALAADVAGVDAAGEADGSSHAGDLVGGDEVGEVTGGHAECALIHRVGGEDLHAGDALVIDGVVADLGLSAERSVADHQAIVLADVELSDCVKMLA